MTNYFVSTYNGVDGAGRSGAIDQPFATLTYAVTRVGSGDTCYLRREGAEYGIWTMERLAIIDKAYAAETTFRDYPDDTYVPTIDGDGYTLPDPYEDALVRVEDSTNVTVQGLYIPNSGKFGMIAWGGSYVKFIANETYNSGNSGIICWYGNHYTFNYNTVRKTNVVSRDGECLSIAGGSSYVECAYNEIYEGAPNLDGGAGGEGLNLKDGVSYCWVHHNIIRDLNTTGSTTRYSCGVDGWDASETHHLYFYNNIAYNNGYGFICECEKNAGWVHDVYFYNNIAYDINTSGIAFLDWVSDSPKVKQGLKQDIYIYNNTVYACARGIHFITNESNPKASNYDNIVVKNNLFYGSTTAEVTYDTGVQTEEITYSNNFADEDGDADFVVTDDPTDSDFCRPASTSDAIGFGTAVSGGASSPYTDVSVDWDGIARPQGGTWDAGVYEYVGGTPEGVLGLAVYG